MSQIAYNKMYNFAHFKAMRAFGNVIKVDIIEVYMAKDRQN